MSRISPKKKAIRIKIKQGKAAKLAKLRRGYAKTKSNQEKEALWQKVRKLSPFLSKQEFEATLPKKE